MTRSPSTASAYDDDFFAWTQEQAAHLRALSATGDVDIANVAEEIEDLGERDLREVRSLLVHLLEHMMKIDALPAAREQVHWRVEAMTFQMSATEAFSPSMRRLMDVERIWGNGRKLALAVITEAGASAPPQSCPFELDDLLSEHFDINAALAKLAGPRPAGNAGR